MDYKKILKELGGTKPNVLIKNNSKRDSLQNIEKLRRLYKDEIPLDFVSFIKTIGAITFNLDIVIKGIENIPVSDNENKVSIDNFYDFANDKASIISIIERFSGNLPENLLPICDGESGDLIVILMNGKNYGKIYYWFHEMEDEYRIYLVANSFSEFIEMLEIKIDTEDISSKDDEEVKVSNVNDKFLERLRNSGKIK